MAKEFRGSYTVMVTPFKEDGGGFDEGAMRRFVDWQIAEGVPGLIVLGSMGEFLTLTDDERTHVVETTIRQARKRVPVLVGTMNQHTPDAVRYSREAERLGADGVMIVPPYYYTPTEDEVFKYYRQISEAISIPIMLYNNPVLTHIDMSARLVARLTKAFANVRYIKEASMDAARCYDIVRLTDDVMCCFAGGRVYESFLMGAKGYVSPPGNFAPREATLMFEALLKGDMKTGKRLSDAFSDLYAIMGEGHPTYGYLTYTKALCRLAGYPMGEVRPPFTTLKELGMEGIARLERQRRALEAMGAFKATAKVAAE